MRRQATGVATFRHDAPGRMESHHPHNTVPAIVTSQ